MSLLLCPKCQKSTLRWLGGEPLDLETSVMKCKRKRCGAEFVGIPGFQAAVEANRKPSEWFLKIEACLAANAFATVGSEYNMVVARDENGKAVGFGRTHADALANVFKRKGLSL